MPIYEYQCRECGRISEFLLLSRREETAPACRRCGSRQMERVLSRVRTRLSEETRLERLADPARFGDLDEHDPRSLARMMKNLAPALGEDYPGEVDDLVEEALESGGEGGGLEDEDLD